MPTKTSRFAGRPLDRIWFIFLAAHIPITLAMDAQAVYPASLVDGTPLQAFGKWYTTFSRDPIMTGILGRDPAWGWMMPFFWLEMVFQIPCFILGAMGLWKNDKRVYPLLVAYGASTATTLLPTLQALLFDTKTSPPLNAAELGLLLSSYGPFLAIPLAMAVDMSFRIIKLINAGVARKDL